jgi:tetratricopeptide (TPR) repeat protein
MVELLDENPKINPKIASEILRNKEGLNNLPLGYGSEKALNQMLTHHGIIFKPEQKLVWVSANPYQMGEFVCYDLNKIFKQKNLNDELISLQQENFNIPKDVFLESESYLDYEKFRVEDRLMDRYLETKTDFSMDFEKKYQSLNSNYWFVYYKVGLYYYYKNNFQTAKEQFEMALTKEITTLPEKIIINKYLKKIQRKLK